MNLQFFSIPALNPEEATDDLNRFCAGRKVVNVDRRFVEAGNESFWSICVCSHDAQGKLQKLKNNVDYREILDEDEFALFVKLRALRKDLAVQEGVPPYAIFTNEQLAEMIRRKAANAADLAEIKGIGESRLARHGHLFAQALAEARTSDKVQEKVCREENPN